jgi:mannose-6-phosphate isomerase-like protein (cupin superfamily)
MEAMDVTRVKPEVHETGSKIYELVGQQADNAKHHSIAYLEFVPGASCDWHHHPAGFEESYYILEGTAEVHINDEYHLLKPGQAMSMPPLVPHNLTNIGDAVLKFLSVSTPPWEESLHIPSAAV